MNIDGTEYGFMLTTEAAIEIAKLCPKKNLSRYGELISDEDYEKTIGNVCKLGAILNKGYADNAAVEGRTNKPTISEEELKAKIGMKPLYVFIAMQNEITVAIARDISGNVDVKEKKDAKKGRTEADS